MRSYISRVEGGYTAPSLVTLEKFAKALGVEPYQVLFEGSGRARHAKLPEQAGVPKPAKRLVKLFESMSTDNRKVLLMMARKLGKD